MTRRPRQRAHAAPPQFIDPCLATLSEEVPQGPEWAFEIKFDGYRMQVHLEGGATRLLTRTGLDWTTRFKTLPKAFEKLKAKSAIIDGEAIVEDEAGVSSFTELVEELNAKTSGRIVFVAFDLLFLDGEDLRALPLAERKALLKALLDASPKSGRIRYSEHMLCDGAVLFKEAYRLGLEGLIAKRLDKPYRSGRHADWLKLKCVTTDVFVIGGYLDSTAMRHAVGALALGVYRGKKFVYVGRVGTGFTQKVARDLWKALQPLRADASPFSEKLAAKDAKSVVWVKPLLVAQIEYRSWTGDGILRHASFLALREDKPAKDVRAPPAD